jgi:hypothetical protein
MPKGWKISAGIGKVARVAQITIDERKKKGEILMDSNVFEDPDIPEGCKIFMLFHEFGHLIHGANESACDEFAFWHSLRAGVTPFTCFLALALYMPKHYSYRVERLGKLILKNPQLAKFTDAD